MRSGEATTGSREEAGGGHGWVWGQSPEAAPDCGSGWKRGVLLSAWAVAGISRFHLVGDLAVAQETVPGAVLPPANTEQTRTTT